MFEKYWGKADETYAGEPKWHPLVYHCLDVAAVAAAWWDENPALHAKFRSAFSSSLDELPHLRAWVLFFVALHDLGKLDVRFQLKAPEAMAAAWRRLEQGRDHEIPLMEIRAFDHGQAGMAWAKQEMAAWLKPEEPVSVWPLWENWLAAVTGHHGDYTVPGWPGLDSIEAEKTLTEHDRQARLALVAALAKLFLEPVGMRLIDPPPNCPLPARALLAGFCSTCDWLGSNADIFNYQLAGMTLNAYFEQRIQHIRQQRLLEHFGLLASPIQYAGLQALLATNEMPRGVQTVIDALPVQPGMTLIEAPTGSGKTEAALACAWRLLAAGEADSIVFALPTQATANAMLQRLEDFAVHAFGQANIVLAHGKRQFNAAFQQLVERGQRPTAQGEEDAATQCAAWLASSRKRVFLGQIGVCTVDQVLLSVLPVRHKFVRGFGLAKSVLIVDEVHAYDAYMHGLLGEVLKNQAACGGSAILLSATLPAGQRAKLLEAWESVGPEDASAPYPAIWQATGGVTLPITVAAAQQPPRREVEIECLRLTGAFPDESLLARIVAAGESGALVAIVVNLVDDAQRLTRLLRERTQIEVDIFHARYRYADRKEKEDAALKHYGRHAPRTAGRILVATQVVEQSLDLDFDWMITQICPVDLLFQRLGRLHRHVRAHRPPGHETPRCTVLTVEGKDYGVFELIYGNARVLWRTDTLLSQNVSLVFPQAYRDWIEQVYRREDWDDEPEKIAVGFSLFSALQNTRDKDAKRLTGMSVKAFRDEGLIASLTRDGEMSLSVLPLTADGRLLDGSLIEDISKHALEEALDLGAVPVPASWINSLHDCRMETDGPLAGYLQLIMSTESEGIWHSQNGQFTYSNDFGLEKHRHEPA